jgi:hypothetical protein
VRFIHSGTVLARVARQEAALERQALWELVTAAVVAAVQPLAAAATAALGRSQEAAVAAAAQQEQEIPLAPVERAVMAALGYG